LISFKNILARLFWPLFLVIAVWLQLLFPGVDFFAAGIMLCLQREGAGKVVLLTLVCVLIQEGSGFFAFGASILRYGSLIGLFLLGRKFFEAGSPAFILLLGMMFSGIHFFSMKTMAGLQDLVVVDHRLLMESVLLFFVFLSEWLVLTKIYRLSLAHVSRS